MHLLLIQLTKPIYFCEPELHRKKKLKLEKVEKAIKVKRQMHLWIIIGLGV